MSVGDHYVTQHTIPLPGQWGVAILRANETPTRVKALEPLKRRSIPYKVAPGGPTHKTLLRTVECYVPSEGGSRPIAAERFPRAARQGITPPPIGERNKRRRLSLEDRLWARKKSELGWRPAQIAHALDCPRSTICGIIKRANP